jgi:hypothetical protein
VKKLKIFGFILFFGSIVIIEGCRKDPVWNTDPNFKLEFSNDTIRFDTVFTSLGSTTLWLQVYNRSDKDIDIRNIELIGGENSFFRMNVNGDTSLFQTNVRLRAKDSMFVFVRVLIDSINAETPLFEILDSIRFSFNNRSQHVILQALGQNAIFHLPQKDTLLEIQVDSVTTLRLPFSIANPSDFLSVEKPHIIYGYLLVQNELILPAGIRLHFAPNAGLIVAEGGSLKVEGSFENEVIFEGMRIDANYRNSTAQWDRIWFLSGSVDNSINWAIIRNGKIGLLVDSMPTNQRIEIKNTIIDNMQNHGIFAKNAIIRGQNLQVSNCGERLLAMIGGDYTFEHCTFANYFRSRRMASVFLDSTSFYPSVNVDFISCIIYGMQQDELEIKVSNTQHIRFSYCNIRTRINSNNSIFQNCKINFNPNFKNPSDVNANFDINFSQVPSVIALGRPSPNISHDLKNRPRAHFPTIGAYEFME